MASTTSNSWLPDICQFWFLIKGGGSVLCGVQFNVSSLRMVTNRVLLVVAFLFGSGFAQSGTAESCTRLQAEATVEIQHEGQAGSGVILMTSNPTSCAAFVDSNPSGTLSSSVTAISTTSATSFHNPLSFGISRTQMINATSTGQQLFPKTTGSSQILTGVTASQSLSEPSTSTPQTSLVAGSGTRPDVIWSHVFFWAAVTELVIGFL